MNPISRSTRLPSSRGNNLRPMNLAIAGLATTLLVAGGLAAASTSVGAGVAQALPSWCPGQPLPTPDVAWDMGLCHYYSIDPAGGVNTIGDFLPPGVRPRPADPNWCADNPIPCHTL